jgi:hypothetical protein
MSDFSFRAQAISWPQSLYFAVYGLVVIGVSITLQQAFRMSGTELAGAAIVVAFGLFWGGFLPLYRRLPSRWK